MVNPTMQTTEKSRMRYAIYGTGGFGREVAPVVSAHWLYEAQANPEGDGNSPDIVFVDDAGDRPSHCNQIPVIGFDQLASTEHNDRGVIVAIGSGATRRRIEDRCRAAGLRIATIVAPSAKSLDRNEIGAGSILCDQVIITANARIGRSFQANIYSYVAHDCVIGDYVTFAPRVSCNGNVHIGDHVYVGTNACFIQGTKDEPLTIGDGAIIGMGAVVTKPVAPRTLVVGNPARFVRSIA